MVPKVREKEKAVELRKSGFSYKDILNVVPVAKSSLSLWLKDLPLTNEEKDSLEKRKDSNISKGRIKAATANRRNRLNRERKQFLEAKDEFNVFKNDPYFVIGIALYWAEGSKRDTAFHFVNSDYTMIKFMIVWILKYLSVPKNSIYLRLHLHSTYAHENCEEFWSEKTGIPLEFFKKTIYKQNTSLVKKRPNYKGCMRIELTKSMVFLRKMQFWQKLLVAHFNNQS